MVDSDGGQGACRSRGRRRTTEDSDGAPKTGMIYVFFLSVSPRQKRSCGIISIYTTDRLHDIIHNGYNDTDETCMLLGLLESNRLRVYDGRVRCVGVNVHGHADGRRPRRVQSITDVPTNL